MASAIGAQLAALQRTVASLQADLARAQLDRVNTSRASAQELTQTLTECLTKALKAESLAKERADKEVLTLTVRLEVLEQENARLKTQLRRSVVGSIKKSHPGHRHATTNHHPTSEVVDCLIDLNDLELPFDLSPSISISSPTQHHPATVVDDSTEADALTGNAAADLASVESRCVPSKPQESTACTTSTPHPLDEPFQRTNGDYVHYFQAPLSETLNVQPPTAQSVSVVCGVRTRPRTPPINGTHTDAPSVRRRYLTPAAHWPSVDVVPARRLAYDQLRVTQWARGVLDPNSSPDECKNHGDAIFDSAAERCRAMDIHAHDMGWIQGHGEHNRVPYIFKHGLRYQPDEDEADIHRSVLLRNLPVNLSMQEILNKVRGGLVVSAVIMDTVSITGSKSAIVVFFRAKAASDFVDFARNLPLKLGSRLPEITWLATPTWPMASSLITAISEHDHTRCLELSQVPDDVTEAVIRRSVRPCEEMMFDAVETFERDMEQRKVCVRFSSVNYAGQAFGILTRRVYFCARGIKVRFTRDPCSGPLEELVDLPEEKKPRFDPEAACFAPSAAIKNGDGTVNVPAIATAALPPRYAV